MYKAIRHGKLRGWSGKQYRFFAGQTVNAPNGDLWNCPAVEWKGNEPEEMPEFETGVETIYPEGYSKNVITHNS